MFQAFFPFRKSSLISLISWLIKSINASPLLRESLLLIDGIPSITRYGLVSTAIKLIKQNLNTLLKMLLLPPPKTIRLHSAQQAFLKSDALFRVSSAASAAARDTASVDLLNGKAGRPIW